jgi:hypothetical protein
MDSSSSFGLIFFLVLLAIMAWWYGKQIRHYIMRVVSHRWPSASAVIQKGGVRPLSGPKGSRTYGSFFGYAYVVNGTRYAAIFALLCGEDRAKQLQNTVNGDIIIHYNPEKPNISFLRDPYDQRFEGIAATQNPEWLDQGRDLDTSSLRLNS